MFSKIKLYKNKVYIYYKKNDVLLRYDTGVKITNKNNFSERTGVKSNIENYKGINNSIFSLQKKIDNIILQNKDNPSINIDRQFVSNELHREKLRKNDILLDYYDEFIKWKRENIIEYEMSLNSLKDYKSIKNTIVDFEKKYNIKLKLIDVNKKEFISRYRIFQREKRNRQEGYKTSGGLNQETLQKRMTLFFSFLKYIQEKGYFTFDIKLSQSKSKSKKGHSSPIIDVLSIDEVKLLKNFPIKEEFDRKVRDIFIFSCYTGLRWSDIITLDKSQVKTSTNGIHFIQKKSVKTSENIEIPLNKTSLDILKKYSYNLKFTTNQQFNRSLKNILKDTNKFNEVIDKLKEDGTKYKRYEVISIHKGRHTFVSNLIENNTPVNVIMKYTGHTKLETLMVYITRKVQPTLDFVNSLE